MAGFNEGKLPIKYLGIPLAAEGLPIAEYAPMLEKIQEQIGKWNAASLTYAGRLQLLKSVIQGIQAFWLSILPVPVGVIKRLDRMCRLFLWAGNKSLVSWKDISLPKLEGGLGIRSTAAWNKSLLTKILWRIIHDRNSIWNKWIKLRYLRNTGIWEMQNSSSASALIRRILHIRDTLISRQGGILAAQAKLISWSETTITRDAYNFFRHDQPAVGWSSMIWNNFIPPKCSFIFWLALKGRLYTKDKINHIDLDKTCLFCRQCEESNQHIYASCPFVSQVFSTLLIWLKLPAAAVAAACNAAATGLDELTAEMERLSKGRSWASKKKRLTLAIFVYQIWIARNDIVFKGCSLSMLELCNRIKTYVYRVGYALYPNVSILD